jgi:hypothetical protein
MYDAPYRLEEDGVDAKLRRRWAIQRTGEGTICTGYNFTDMRRLVDCANEAALQEQGDRGR